MTALKHRHGDGDPDPVMSISLSGAQVAAARNLLSMLVSSDDADTGPEADLVDRARRIIEARRMRRNHFARSMFDETAWDMMLALYVSDAQGILHTLSRLAGEVGAPLTSAARWVAYLEAQHLVRKSSHPDDRRSAIVTLTGEGRSAMAAYLFETMSLRI